VKSTVKGAAKGKLAGKTVVLKDNVMLAGRADDERRGDPGRLRAGDRRDRATRILDAGGTILGKAHCEHFCLSAAATRTRPVQWHNPHKRGYSAAVPRRAARAWSPTGEADMAIGGDQGGSIACRFFCGIYGMKATHGLVPYTASCTIEIYVFQQRGRCILHARRHRAGMVDIDLDGHECRVKGTRPWPCVAFMP